jgi:hypothetical protein
MWQLRGQTLNKFGYDNTGSNVYKFNSQGYRSNIDFDFARPCLVTVGPSTSFGIGLPVEKTFPFLLDYSKHSTFYIDTNMSAFNKGGSFN